MSESENEATEISGAPRIIVAGQRIGMLVTVEQFTRDGVTWWRCMCDCGRPWSVRKGALVSGRSTSCGCRRRRSTACPAGPEVRLWRIWHNMHQRCRKGGDYWKQHGYADRGITVCEEWRSYPRFYAWAMSNGYADDLTIDRRDNDAGYHPSNCRWVTNTVQARNTRRTVWVDHRGTRVSLAEAVEDLGLDYDAAYNRHVRAGRPFPDVVGELLGGSPFAASFNSANAI
ncbi:hypothetical protein [Sphingomonas sp. CV7422]|uniref:hypothetical protein n=1 Tax=Sphingomonas sp. CV7422 TaxID=3018036 RepID=UPI0022FE4380|nr:hypothetical protein [Sphingomonas sp. CV7422]